ncbi:MAG TPA: VCBS repeat-containing protein [Polyangiaceae bacterium]|nr:VCBS repeat-containing protein [Polyangiaceae bacterium]
MMLGAIRLMRGRALSVYASGVLLSLLAPVACGDGDTLPTGSAGSGGSAGRGGSSGEGGEAGQGAASGKGGSGGMGEVTCPTVAFISPLDGAKLTDADDIGASSDANSCSDGFQYNVKASTSATDGTDATLYSGTNMVAQAMVKGGEITFANVQLSIGVDVLKIQVGDDACTPAQATAEVSCQGLPACDITKPVISATHPALNGVPVAQGGDRASAVGSPYQVAFEVTTNVEDGRPVSLQVNDSAQLITAFANSGKATFSGVPLSPDGDFSVVASCQAQSGKTSRSAAATFTVDTAAPQFLVTAPVAGKHFGPSEDSEPAQAGQQFQVCGLTQALDALNLPDNLGAAKNNFCVGVGTATPLCVPVTGDTSGAPCVTLTCQDRVPFDLKVSLADLAGNSSQTTVQSISCTSELPGVAIVNPVDGTGSDISTHILAASATSGRKDESASKAGAQFTVVACTDVPNAPMTLLGAVKGQTQQSLATTTSVAAVPTDNCPTGKSYVGKFVGATLPESDETVLGELVNPTELAVTVSDQGTVGTSPLVDVWVDSVSPSISQYLPNPLCGLLIQSATAVSKPVTLLTSSLPVLVTVTNNGTAANYTATFADLGQAPIGSVAFGLGVNTFVATTVDPAGNPGALITPCEVTVGNPPSVAWVSPTGSRLNILNDSDPSTDGWQGTLSVQTDIGGSGATIQFSTAAGNLGAPVAIDATGKATSPVVSLSDAAAVTLTATTSDVPGRGMGSAKLTVAVDTVAPAAVTSFAATVPPALRRQTTFHLGWLAPSDAGSAVASYDVRIAKGTPITAANFDAQEKVPYSGAPSAPGATDGIDAVNRLIENDYYFALAPIDKGGNRGPMTFTGPTAAHFKSTILSPGIAGEMFGFTVDGSTSLDGDGYSDLVVGAFNSQTVYIYMGSATGYANTPTSKITGSTIGFGSSVGVVGDIDSDGLPELAIGSPNEGGNGVVFIFKGRRPWPSSLQQSAADYVIQTTGSDFAGSRNGTSVANVGDYNGDGVDDLAIGAALFGGTNGRVSVVFGVPQGQSFGTAGVVTLPADYGTKAVAISGTNGAFGQRVLGLNRFYTGGGSTLVATATLGTGAADAFHGLAGAAAVTTPDQTFAGPVTNGRTGLGLAFLGGGPGLPLVAVGSPGYDTNPPAGRVDVFGGAVSSGPFSGAHAIYTNSRATSLGDSFGIMTVGGAFTSGSTNFLGDSAPDLVVGGFKEAGGGPRVYLLTGQNAITPGSRDIVSAADASFQMPADWEGCAFLSGAIRDSDGDGYGDLAVGEFKRGTGYNGRVLVLW